MGFQFANQHHELAAALNGSYEWSLVALSLFIAAAGAYAGLGLASRARGAESGGSRFSWLGAGAAAMGLGVWAMHFVGMLAFRLPIPVAYDVAITLASVLPAILASAVVLLVISQAQLPKPQWLGAGVLMGLGIGAMHYSGMSAMRMAASMVYDPAWFAASLLISVALATLALGVRVHEDDKPSSLVSRIKASAMMGFAVTGMHYTAMEAAYFLPSASGAAPSDTLDPSLLALLVSIGTFLVLALAVFVVVIDQRLSAAALSVRTSRTRMIQAISSISEGFALYDNEDRLVLRNERYGQLLHPGNHSIVPGETFESVIRAVVDQGLITEAVGREEEWVQARLARHANPSGPFVQQRSDGRWIQISERKTGEGGTVAIYTDITPLKQAELEITEALESLKSAQTQLVQSERMAVLGQLAAGLAHEINNPIGVVHSSADNSERCVRKMLEAIETSRTLDEVKADRTFQKSVDIIRENSRVILDASNRVARIVKTLQSFARIDHPESGVVDLHESIDTTLSLLEHKLPPSLRLEKRYGSVPEIAGDASEINQVMMTLLNKAIQAVEGAGCVSIETDHANGEVRVRIAYDGQGMTEDEVASLFDLKFTTRGTRVGVSIGLTHVRHILHKHEGEITVQSEPGQGTLFEITLPVQTK